MATYFPRGDDGDVLAAAEKAFWHARASLLYRSSACGFPEKFASF